MTTMILTPNFSPLISDKRLLSVARHFYAMRNSAIISPFVQSDLFSLEKRSHISSFVFSLSSSSSLTEAGAVRSSIEERTAPGNDDQVSILSRKSAVQTIRRAVSMHPRISPHPAMPHDAACGASG